MAESRGGNEDRKLKESYVLTYDRGAWMQTARSFQQALTSKELKVKLKSANVAGLQLADVLSHPVRDMVLAYHGRRSDEFSPFTTRILAAVKRKYNCHLYNGNAEGYGFVLFPK